MLSFDRQPLLLYLNFLFLTLLPENTELFLPFSSCSQEKEFQFLAARLDDLHCFHLVTFEDLISSYSQIYVIYLFVKFLLRSLIHPFTQNSK